jgi:light-independent protochlorophyllide reductase subunit N
MVVGALPDVVEDQFRACWPRSACPVQLLARRGTAGEMPGVGPNTRYLLAQPFLADTARALEGAARSASPRPSRSAWKAPTAWLQAAAAAFGIAPARVPACHGPARPRAEGGVARQREALQGKRIFFFPDSQLELPLARFLARELGMQLTEVGTPFLHREHLAPELALLPAGTTLSEGQDVDRQLDRCRALAPDSRSAAWAWPTRWRPRA